MQADFEGVNEAVMDKAYMGQLVSVQHQVKEVRFLICKLS
jgi:hypothetical protein